MGAATPVARIIITRPRHGAYVVLSHVIEFVVNGFRYSAGFGQSPTFRADRTGGLITIIIHVSGSGGSGGGVGVIYTVGIISGFRLVAGADGFSTFRVLIPAGSALAGSGVGGADGGPVGGDV